MVCSLERSEVRVVTSRGEREERRDDGKGEGPRDWSLEVSVVHVETISLRTLDFGFEWVGSADSAFNRAVHSVAIGSERLSRAEHMRSKVGRFWNRVPIPSCRV
jgi:hypothetical protein